MRWVLPGGATLGGSDRGGNERLVACRPRAAVEVRPPPHLDATPPQTGAGPDPVPPLRPPSQPPAPPPRSDSPPAPPPPRKRRSRRPWLSTVKRLLEVLAVLVGLISAILALL